MRDTNKIEEEWRQFKTSVSEGCDQKDELTLRSLLELRPGPLTPEMVCRVDDDLFITDSNFFVRHYVQILDVFASKITSKKWLTLLTELFVVDGGDGQLLFESLTTLTNLLKQSRAPSTKCDNVIAIASSLLESDFIASALVRECMKPSCNDYWTNLVRLLISFPSHLANILKTATPDLFSPPNYCRILFVNILNAVQTVARACHFGYNDCVVDIVPISSLLSKILSSFDCKYEFEKVVSALESSCVNGYSSYSDTVQNLFAKLEGSAVSRAALTVFSRSSASSVVRLLGDDILSSLSWRHCISDALFFKTYQENDNVLKNLVAFLRQRSPAKLVEIMIDLLELWGDKFALERTPFEQHLYVSKAIILSSDALGASVKDKFEKIQSCVFLGVPHHLESPDERMRVAGMVVAEFVMGRINPDSEHKIEFDYGGLSKTSGLLVQELQSLRVYANAEETVPDNLLEEYTRKLPVVQTEVTCTTKEEGTRAAHSIIDVKIADSLSAKTEVHPSADVDDWDSDDELEPYDLSNDVRTSTLQKPTYLRDLIDGLVERNNADIWIGAVEGCEEVIKTQLIRDDPCMGVEILSLLMTLEQQFYMENFEKIRYSAAVAIVNIYPEECATFLGEEFHQPMNKYSLPHRTFMLDVLAGSVRELAQLKSQPRASVEKEITKKEEHDWKRIIRERIEQKTKYKTSQKTRLVTRESNLNSCIGHFFYPLIRGCAKIVGRSSKTTLSHLIGVDWYSLLAQYVDTLAIIVCSAVNCVPVTKMALELLEFTKCLRFHVNSTVRCSVLRCTGAALISFPRTSLSEAEVVDVMCEIRSWLETILQSSGKLCEESRECRETAVNVLGLMRSMFSNSL